MGFKARVGCALFKLCGGIHDIRSLIFTSGVTPLPVYIASIAAGRFPHMRVSAEVGCRCGDLNQPPIFRAPMDHFYCCEWDPIFINVDFLTNKYT